MTIGWPEGIWLTLTALNLLLVAAVDGHPKQGDHNFALSLCGTALVFGLLWWGGFFA